MIDLTPDRDSLDPIEIASRDEISELQEKRLAWTLDHAYRNSAFFKKRFDEHGAHPGDFKSLADIARFPFTVKQDLRDTYPFGMFATPREDLVRIHGSSGTTGKPTVVGYTANDISHWSDLIARSIRAAGGRKGNILHNAYGYGLFTGGLGAHYGAERLGCTVVPISGGMTERQVTLIEDFRPDIIMVTPSYMLSILDEYRRRGLDARQSSLKVGIFGAEPWTNAMRREIEQAFDMHAVDIYGLSEIMGPGVANECVETKDGLHIWEDHFYPEIVNPETLEPVAYFEKLASDIDARISLIVDPMLATGGSMIATIDTLKKAGCTTIRALVLVAAPEGIKKVQAAHPDVDIFCASIDDHLNENGYIIPGLGDAGDKIFGTR